MLTTTTLILSDWWSTRAGLIHRFHSGLRSLPCQTSKPQFTCRLHDPTVDLGQLARQGRCKQEAANSNSFSSPFLTSHLSWLGNSGGRFFSQVAHRLSLIRLQMLAPSPSCPSYPSSSFCLHRRMPGTVWVDKNEYDLQPKSFLISNMDQEFRNEIACKKHNLSITRLIHPERVRTGRWKGNPAGYWQPNLLQQLQRPPAYPNSQMETLQLGNKMEYDEYPLNEEINFSNLQETTETSKQPGPMTLPSIKLPSISMPTLVPRRGLLVIRWV